MVKRGTRLLIFESHQSPGADLSRSQQIRMCHRFGWQRGILLSSAMGEQTADQMLDCTCGLLLRRDARVGRTNPLHNVRCVQPLRRSPEGDTRMGPTLVVQHQRAGDRQVPGLVVDSQDRMRS